MNRNITLVLNAHKPEEMAEKFRTVYHEIDQRAKITPVNLGNGFSRDIPSTTDEILFTGGVRESLGSNPELKEEAFNLVRGVAEPVLGVCFGAQVVARAHGARLVKMPAKREGEAPVEIIVAGKTYLGQYAGRPQLALESHTWALDEDSFPGQLEVLGRSEDGVEIFAHHQLPHGGVQFHPELGVGRNDGLHLFDGLRKSVLDKAKRELD